LPGLLRRPNPLIERHCALVLHLPVGLSTSLRRISSIRSARTTPFVALVRAGAKFHKGVMIERRTDQLQEVAA